MLLTNVSLESVLSMILFVMKKKVNIKSRRKLTQSVKGYLCMYVESLNLKLKYQMFFFLGESESK